MSAQGGIEIVRTHALVCSRQSSRLIGQIYDPKIAENEVVIMSNETWQV